MTTATFARSSVLDRVLDRINIQSVGGAVIRYGLELSGSLPASKD
jgi:hypothetical protein